MNRRDFVKGFGGLSLAALLPVPFWFKKSKKVKVKKSYLLKCSFTKEEFHALCDVPNAGLTKKLNIYASEIANEIRKQSEAELIKNVVEIVKFPELEGISEYGKMKTLQLA